MNQSRRMFLLSSAGALAGHATPPAGQVTLGVIGSGGRGTFVMGIFQKDASVRVAAICDARIRNPIAITRNCWPTKTCRRC